MKTQKDLTNASQVCGQNPYENSPAAKGTESRVGGIKMVKPEKHILTRNKLRDVVSLLLLYGGRQRFVRYTATGFWSGIWGLLTKRKK